MATIPLMGRPALMVRTRAGQIHDERCRALGFMPETGGGVQLGQHRIRRFARDGLQKQHLDGIDVHGLAVRENLMARTNLSAPRKFLDGQVHPL